MRTKSGRRLSWEAETRWAEDPRGPRAVGWALGDVGADRISGETPGKPEGRGRTVLPGQKGRQETRDEIKVRGGMRVVGFQLG